MAAKLSLLGLFGLLCLVLQNAKLLFKGSSEAPGAPLSRDVHFENYFEEGYHGWELSERMVASVCAPTDLAMVSNPLTRVYCSYNVTIGGVPATSLTVCTYNPNGTPVLFPTATAPGATPPIPTVSCPGNTDPNSCPASVQPNFATVSAFYQQSRCVYALAAPSGASFSCAYNATGATLGTYFPDCPMSIRVPATSTPTPQPLTSMIASMCPSIDRSSNPLTTFYCSYNVTIGGARAMSLTVCTYYPYGALVTVPGETPPTPPVSCPGSTLPNSCPSSVQRNFANASAFHQDTGCIYAIAGSSAESPLCTYDATGAFTGGHFSHCPTVDLSADGEAATNG
ncbi:hypothetical protein KFL_009970010 [Klebsormidium nitens]|uniref:Uncharacterized protein n=1 Tax=Klebsormidium nitens TaxID=105231 RepID=A0A1Y1IQP7_KLENI|nr:hypothetical protein KFL_009970010 [Klebsormidium nitens]|eukprot:GAQ92372.1 hypothetical protein KFL_009970010 [Klebsormidium nitens]